MRPRPIATLAALAALSAAILASSLGLARPEPQASRRVPAPAARFMGATFCASCHAGPQNPAFQGSLPHVRLDEFTVWKRDPHALAYEGLKGAVGIEMGRRLGVDVTKPEAGCLGCHSTNLKVEGVSHPTGDLFRLADGVSCEACHGPSEAWIAEHTQHDWRRKTADEKKALGMVDLRDPARQSSLCVSCHVGDGAGKLLTHAMFAAGHPPVPSIDAATSCESLPRHWRLLGEKPGAGEAARFERSRLAIVAAATALKSSMALLAEETRSPAPAVPGAAWPDYARFDCTSCHHELVRPSRRQERGYEGPPGRPPLARWSTALVRIAVDELLKEDGSHLLGAMSDHEKALVEATNHRPFGRLPDLGKAAASYAGWADDAATRLARAPLHDGRIRPLLLRIATEAAERELDIEAARLAARAAWAFHADLGPDPKHDREIVEALCDLSDKLDLRLPGCAGPPGAPPRGPVGDPGRAREAFRRIAEALKGP